MQNNKFEKVTSKTSKLEQEIKNLKKRIYSPKVNLIERDNSYLIKIELPGIIKESIDIKIKENQIIIISGNKIKDELYDTDRIIYRESKYDDFSRRIKLPSAVKPENFKTDNLNFQNGVLYLSFQKSSVNNIQEHKSWADESEL
jgi:HSP20 family protein